MAVDGQRGIEDIASFQRVIDISPEIMTLEPTSTPFSLLTRKIGKQKPAQDPEFSWVEDEREERYGEVDGSHDDSTTTISVADSEPFYKHSLVRLPRTNEQLLVTAVDRSGDDLTVVRGYSGTTAASMDDEDILHIVSSIAEEGSGAPEARTFNPTKVTNNTQIFKRTLDKTGTARSSANETSPHDWQHHHRKKAFEHAVDLELASIFGVPSVDTTNNDKHPIRTTGGALHYMTQNNLDVGGGLSETVLEGWVRDLCQRGSKTKVTLCAPNVLSAINKFGVDKLETSTGDKTYGIEVTEYICAHGRLKLIPHPEMYDAYSDLAIAIDMREQKTGWKPLNGKGAPGGTRDTKVLTNVQPRDVDGQIDMWLTEGGFVFGLPRAGGVMRGVTGAA